MAIIAKANESGSKFPTMDAGSYAAICYAIVVTGTVHSEKFDNFQTKVTFLWELPDEQIEIDSKMQPRAISASFTLSLSEKANLRKMLEGWRGKTFSEEELKGFDLVAVLGKPCLLSIITGQKSNGDNYNKVSGVSRLPKGMTVPAQVNQSIVFDVRSDEMRIMDKLPEWLRGRCMESIEYNERVNSSAGGTVAIPAESESVGTDDLPF